MKRLLLSIVSAVCMFTCFALDTIHLNNGRVVTGTITQIEEGVSITIMMENGREYTYPLIEVKSYDKGHLLKWREDTFCQKTMMPDIANSIS